MLAGVLSAAVMARSAGAPPELAEPELADPELTDPAPSGARMLKLVMRQPPLSRSMRVTGRRSTATVVSTLVAYTTSPFARQPPSAASMVAMSVRAGHGLDTSRPGAFAGADSQARSSESP